jgi:hypothetical protein
MRTLPLKVVAAVLLLGWAFKSAPFLPVNSQFLQAPLGRSAIWNYAVRGDVLRSGK